MEPRHDAHPGSSPRGPARPRPRRRATRWFGALAIALIAPFALDSCFAGPRYQGPVTDHFDGSEFRNRTAQPPRGLLPFLKWRSQREGGRWKGYSGERVEPKIEPRVEGDELRVTFVNHATVLIQTAGLNLLTDPIWSRRASPVSFAGPERHVEPGVAFDELPPIDVVVVSHNHYDHLDLETLRRLADEHAPTFLVPLGNRALLKQHGIADARDVDWWDEVDVAPDASVACVPAEHFSGRGISDRNATLWAGFVLRTPGGVVYFAGDTGAGPHFGEVRERYGPPRLAILPIGAYLPRWFMSPVHIDPREAVLAHLELGARVSLGMHFGCFELADDGPEEPVVALDAALEELGVAAEAFWVLAHGETRPVP